LAVSLPTPRTLHKLFTSNREVLENELDRTFPARKPPLAKLSQEARALASAAKLN